MDHSDHGMDMGGHGEMDHDMGHDDMGHGDMGHDMGGGGGGHSMAMTFYYSTTTPLFSEQWTPQNVGQYAGTCIFLIVLAVILRVMLALRPILEARLWSPPSIPTKQVDQEEDTRPMLDSNGKALSLMKRDVGRRWSGWKVSTAMWRATYELLLAGVGYLLMLAVMSFNVGYFLSVLGGIWLGTFVLGGLSFDDNSSIHC